jgi:PAS domain S-box-containing protein
VTTRQDDDILGLSAALQTANSVLIARQRAAQRSEFYLAEGQRLAPMGNWAFSPSGFFYYWSPELFQIYGLDPAKGPPTVDEYLASVHPQDRQFMAKAIEEMRLEAADCDVQQRILRPDGELRHIRWVGVPVLHDGAFNGFVGTALDVTEQKHLAQDLRRREAYLAEAQRLSRTGSFGWSVPSGEILWSEETFRIFQYERTTKPTLELILQRVHPKDLTRVEQTIERALRDGTNFDFEHRLLMPDGSVKHVHIVAHALRDQAGSIEFSGAVMDITAAKETEEILRQRETELVQLIDVVPQFIFVLAPDGKRLYANKVLLDYHGPDFSVDAFRDGSTLGRYCHPEDLELFRRERQNGLARGIPFEIEGRQLGNDGRYRWFLFRYNPLRDEDGRILRWYGTATDMDDRRRAGEALRRSEAYLAEAQRLSRTGSFGWNVSSGELFWSEETFRIFGYDRATRPTVQLALQRVHPDDIALVQQLMERASHDAKDWDLEHRLLMPDGSVKHLHVVAHARDEAGNLEFMGAVMDVTPAKQAEEALRKSESYLAEAQRLSHTGSWTWAPATGEIRYWSEECFRVLGFDPARAPPRFETFFQRIHPDDQPGVTELLERATRERSDFTLDYRIIHPEGRIRDIHVVGHPVFNSPGDLAEFVGTVIDVTERKQADEERQNHLWFLESMDKVNRAIQGTNDLEQMTSDVLGAVLSIFGCDRVWLVYPCDPEAASWRAAMEHTRPEYPGAFALGIDLPLDAEVANVFQTARASSGAVQFGSGSDCPVPAQLAERFGIQSLIAIAVYPKVDKPCLFGLHQCSYPRIWTAREERLFQEVGRRLGDGLTGLLMLRNLQESEAKLEEAQRIAHVGYWERDLRSNLVTWSDEGFRIFGLAPGNGSVAFTQYRELIHSEDRQRVVAAVAEALRGGPRYNLDYRVVRPNGEVRIVHSQGDVMRDESGRPRRMFGVVQDITERKRAEEDLRESERRYRETQMELAHVNRVTTMGQLTASIAHEVNQPIAAVVTNAGAGLRWLAAQPPNLDEVRDTFDRIIKAGYQASEVIGRIRALIKKVPARKTTLDINETILETIAVTRSEMQRHCILLQTDLANDLPSIRGDRVQLQQVILNLIMNAIEAMSEVRDDSRELVIGSNVDTPDGVLVTVQDSGPGLKQDSLNQLFDPFFTTKPAGMGMGLSICRSIIEAHDGRLWATANAPRGAVFQFTLHQDDEF